MPGGESQVAIRWLSHSCLCLVAAALLVLGSERIVAGQCQLPPIGAIPLNDLGQGSYQGHEGGLYPGGSNVRPAEHLAEGLALALDAIEPLDTNGLADAANGRIVLISIGISNTSQEFASGGPGAFRPLAMADLSRNPQVVIVDCAQGGHSALEWADPNDSAWPTADSRIVNAGVRPAQVQVAWVKLAELAGNIPDSSFPAHAQWHQDHLAAVLRLLKIKYPNLRIAFMSSRTRSHRWMTGGNPEPIACESNFAVKWLIECQMAGACDLNWDPGAGPVVAPFVTWGPYLWADGESPRSDGLVWLGTDVNSMDCNHPSVSGVAKVGDQLLAMFKSDPLAAPWFLRQTTVGLPPTCTIGADVTYGEAPLTVNFTSAAADADGTVASTAWMFDDGCYTTAANPTKTYPVAGRYTVRLTVADNVGNSAIATRTVFVGVAPELGDCDQDGDVDEADLGILADCLLGPGAGAGSGCDCSDFDADGDNDLVDFASFQMVFSP